MAYPSLVSRNAQEHRRALENFYVRFAGLWPETLCGAFDLLGIYDLPRREIAAITQATEAIGRIYNRTASLLRTIQDEALLQMGVSKSTLQFSRTGFSRMPDTVIGRLDLVRTDVGYKLLDFNADTPGLLVETFAVNAKVCEESEKIDPNRSGEAALAARLETAIRAGLEYVGKAEWEPAQIVFTSCGRHPADREIAEYLMGLLDLPQRMRKRYVALEKLRARRDGLYDPDGNPIDVLYRHHPLQFLLQRLDRNSELPAAELLPNLVQEHKLALINPPFAFLLENKAVQALIWNLYKSGIYFVPGERSLIERYMLPTYLDPAFDEQAYVVKPVYGREGDTISIVDPKKEQAWESTTRTYWEQARVYQEYIELPKIEAMTECGPRVLNLLASCFLVAGQAIGIGMRAGEAVTDESWWFVPVCIAD